MLSQCTFDLCQQHSHSMALEMAGNSWDIYIWSRVGGSKNHSQHGHLTTVHAMHAWCSSWWPEFDVGQQQQCGPEHFCSILILKKKHHACAYYWVCEVIAGRIVKFVHIQSETNFADILSKPLVPHPCETFCFVFPRLAGHRRVNSISCMMAAFHPL